MQRNLCYPNPPLDYSQSSCYVLPNDSVKDEASPAANLQDSAAAAVQFKPLQEGQDF